MNKFRNEQFLDLPYYFEVLNTLNLLPDLDEAIAESIKDKEARELAFTTEAHGDFHFPPRLSNNNNKALTQRVARLERVTGFGIRSVRACCKSIYCEEYPHSNKCAPSDSWCKWFFHEVMKMSVRRKTGKGRPDGEEMTALQRKLRDFRLTD